MVELCRADSSDLQIKTKENEPRQLLKQGKISLYQIVDKNDVKIKHKQQKTEKIPETDTSLNTIKISQGKSGN